MISRLPLRHKAGAKVVGKIRLRARGQSQLNNRPGTLLGYDIPGLARAVSAELYLEKGTDIAGSQLMS